MSRVARPSGASNRKAVEDSGASNLSHSLHSMSLQHQSPSKPARAAADSSPEVCQVCKSSRYLNQHMRFLVNPECYHKMCESCVDRIFSHGPAPCPIAGCKKTLRKARFRMQTFEDLKVEREVDIRRRVAKVMNKQEVDFESLRDYNDYLETVEEITWNLILKIDVEQTERRLRAFEEAQKAELNPNAPRRVMNAGPDTSTLSDTSHVILKKGGTQRRTQTASSGNTPDPSGAEERGFSFKGLKKRKVPEPEKAFDPWGGYSVDALYYSVKDEYDHKFFAVKHEAKFYASGYKAPEYYSHALRDAFGGLGVFLNEEMADLKLNAIDVPLAVGGGRDVEMNDVF
ncbi:CDK-activating kinase assembly factor [Bimuria novae-zelandiae CBS 107.79]|uniref:RNA polymerase II transcription factor B subunit 3 n=1 Tax=Bimuria novae-zelandiae CBS 107.79 TaxID=1447943 RepID=A0A6A5ULT4_9PLEO|nr:CDK-activating kinase assembly factor [Bimuria novae-zelandiae CBS 107.79]